MKTRLLLFSIFTITLVSLGLFITVIFNSAPNGADVFSLFYASLLLSLVGLLFFGCFIYFYLKAGGIPPWKQTLGAIRIGATASLFVIGCLLLQANDLFNWVTVAVLILFTVAGQLLIRKRTLLT